MINATNLVYRVLESHYVTYSFQTPDPKFSLDWSKIVFTLGFPSLTDALVRKACESGRVRLESECWAGGI